MIGLNLKNYNRIIIIDTVNTFGTAVTWTGLPIFALHLTGSDIYTGVLYLTGTIAGILTQLFGGYLVDKYSRKQLISWCLFTNFVMMLTLFTCIQTRTFFLLFPVMTLSQSLGALTYLSQEVWYKEMIEHHKLDLTQGQ
ncbi:hypothetical protein QS257_09780 [Terrilactibacillus sp. S3-3]|nr:hypothetical protein QS257_09780 [Terrilactibacillus sp. S3-3]